MVREFIKGHLYSQSHHFDFWYLGKDAIMFALSSGPHLIGEGKDLLLLQRPLLSDCFSNHSCEFVQMPFPRQGSAVCRHRGEMNTALALIHSCPAAEAWSCLRAQGQRWLLHKPDHFEPVVHQVLSSADKVHKRAATFDYGLSESQGWTPDVSVMYLIDWPTG